MKIIWVHTYQTGSATNRKTIESVHHVHSEAIEQQTLLGGTVEEFNQMPTMAWFREQYLQKPRPEPELIQVLGRGLRGNFAKCIMVDFNDGEKK